MSLQDLDYDHLICRDRSYGHRWEPVSANPMRFHEVGIERHDGRRYRKLERTIRCERCTSVKVEIYLLGTRDMVKIGNRYSYAENYLVPGGVGDAEAVHLEQLRRVGLSLSRRQRAASA